MHVLTLTALEERLSQVQAHLQRAADAAHDQRSLFELVHATATMAATRALVRLAVNEPTSEAAALVLGYEALPEIGLRLARAGMGVALDPLPPIATETLAEVAHDLSGPVLADELAMVRDTFRRFAESEIAPIASEIHRRNLDIPEHLITGLAELGAFGMSVPEAYGGTATGGSEDMLAMLVATEELSRASLGAGGSLITRPEIIARALLAGGTEEQKQRLLPQIASGELMGAVAVTEPDYGSDVAHLTTTATHNGGRWRVSGTKTWCTFAGRADVLAVLARTDPNRDLGHRGLSLLLVPKPRQAGEAFRVEADGGVLEGRAIDTLGYRGMHSFEVRFDGFPAAEVVGGDAGLGRGFYLQMAGFENGRIQTAARAVGLMRAAHEAALAYAEHRRVFDERLVDYDLARAKLAAMAATIKGARQLAFEAARAMAESRASLEASLAKLYACRAAEWVTREAMQLHGGMGYAEEYPVSRYFVDARVLSIFEGAEETLALRVIAKGLPQYLV
jgi:(2S)-methylsuccinyl-CoA dehydrogenase